LTHAAKAEILRRSLIFSSLNNDELAELSKLAIERSFRPDEFVFWEGDDPDYFYIVVEG